MKEFGCVDCEVDTSPHEGIREYYMVENKVWKQAMGRKLGMLCIGCLEQRIGRRVEPTDFTKCPLNASGMDIVFPRSDRLADRLGYA